MSIVCALRFQQLLANKHCVMQTLAEWKNGSANVHDEKKKQRENLEPPRPMAARLKNRWSNINRSGLWPRG